MFGGFFAMPVAAKKLAFYCTVEINNCQTIVIVLKSPSYKNIVKNNFLPSLAPWKIKNNFISVTIFV